MIEQTYEINYMSETIEDAQGNDVVQPSFNSVYMMSDSGARGSAAATIVRRAPARGRADAAGTPWRYRRPARREAN